MKRFFIISLLGLLGLSGHVQGQTVAKLSADTIVLGDQTTLKVPQGSALPSTEQLSQNGIEAIRQEFDSATHTMLTTLTSFEPGIHYIKLSTEDSIPLTVLDVDVDTTSAEIRDIAPIEQVSYTFWEIFRWFILGLGVLALAYAAWWINKHWKKIEKVIGLSAPIDTRTPEERALDNMEILRKKQLWQSGRAKEYHTELTDIIRTFIEEASGIHATEMTSEETIAEMESRKWGVDISLLRDIFMTADLVKFAKGEPLPYEHQRSYDKASAFVKGLWECLKPKESKENEPEGKEP
jgi:hypothetical protein